MLARQPISGPSYISRLRGGVLGDGVSCMIAATFSAFPNTTFAQNNGVIQLTGVASRYVGLYIGAILFCLGMFPMKGLFGHFWSELVLYDFKFRMKYCLKVLELTNQPFYFEILDYPLPKNDPRCNQQHNHTCNHNQ
jgi:hypothetical protein